MSPVATRAPEAFSLVLTGTFELVYMGLVHKISERPSGALVAMGVTCAPAVIRVRPVRPKVHPHLKSRGRDISNGIWQPYIGSI